MKDLLIVLAFLIITLWIGVRGLFQAKKMQIYLRVQAVLIIALILFFVPTGLYSEGISPQSSTISLSASLEKNVFRLNEKILINVIFSNESSKNIFLNTYYNWHWDESDETRLIFDITMPNGKKPRSKVISSAKRRLINKKDFYLLKSGQYLETQRTADFSYTLDQVGKYVIKAYYFNSNEGKKFGLKAWTGEVFSNELTFTIIE